jgi:hypothetical protein
MAPPSGSKNPILDGILSFFRGMIPKAELGEVFQGQEASQAYQDGVLLSQSAGKSLRIAFRNLSSVPLLLCWVSENGDLNHFYKLNPSSGLIGYSDTTVTEGDHIEHTCAGHAFCLAHVPENQMVEAKRLKSLQDTSSIIGGYRPFQNCDEEQVHLITISRGRESEEEIQCCQPTGNLRRRKRRKVTFVHADDSDDDADDEEKRKWWVGARVAKIDPTPWDTSRKAYELRIMGGWPVYAEPNWFDGDSALERRLAQDLQEATKILPSHAVEYLRTNCPIWVNSKIKFGPRACPIKGRGCCYHPDKKWLVENGLSELKHKCIEINDGSGYKKDLDMWGRGGVMVHELSHAYHHRMLPDGYRNKEIMSCYEQAMKEGLYDKVKVHGSQGPEAKAYACSNDKEYFAELSTAFLGGKDDRKEYNKWYPFNRAQIRTHDPRAYKLLCRLWKVKPN